MKIRQITTCHTCRTRKLACDGKTPACSQCVKSGRVCAGYQHDLIFRPPTVSSHHQAPVRNAKRRRTAPPQETGTSRRSRRPSRPEQRPKETHVVELLHHQRPSTILPPLSWPLLDIISLVVQNFSPVEFLEQPYLIPAAAGASPQRICGAWVEALPELARDSEAEGLLSPAIKTLAISIMSRGQHGRASVSDALEAHTVSVSSLRRGLQEMACSSSNVMAATTMCLFLAEMILPTSKSSALVHGKGIGDLLQLQSPGFYSSGVGHQLFVGFRPVMFINFFMTRQNAFLGETRWLEAPFSISGASPLQRLFSELMTLPLTIGVIEDLDNKTSDEAELAGLAAFIELQNSLRRLLTLGEALETDDPDRYSVPRHQLEGGTAIPFPSITAANFFTHKWAFHIVCARHINHLIARFPPLGDRLETGIEGLISREAVAQLGSLILRSIEFITQDKFKMFGAASAMLPLQVVCELMQDEGGQEEELWYWYREVVRISSAVGYDFMSKHAVEC